MTSSEQVQAEQGAHGASVPPKKFEIADLHELLEISDAAKKALGGTDIRDGLRYKEVLHKIREALMQDIQSSEGENKARLEDFYRRIEAFLVAENSEIRVDHEVVLRTSRDIAFAEDVDHFERDEDADVQALSGVLERRKWGNIFTNLEPGDRVVSFLVPGADFLSIKYLNDNIFGPQVTNEIIAQKRKVLENEMNKINPEISFLQSDYKTEVVKIPHTLSLESGVLEQVAAAVDVEMTKFVLMITTRVLENEKDSARIAVLKKFEKDLLGAGGQKKSGFKMNYGVATVAEGLPDQLAENQLAALNQSLQTSRTSRENKNGGYGAEYSELSSLAEVEYIGELRQEIIDAGNQIADQDGHVFEIFSHAENGGYALNRDLLRDVRKNKFKAQAENQQLLEKVALYVKKLNILDAVKPFVKEELSTVQQQASGSRDLARKIKNKEVLSESEKRTAVEFLRTNEKDSEYTSNSEFHKRAVAMKDAAYVSLDVLDLGVDLLLEYESALQQVEVAKTEDKASVFRDVSLSAGDQTTKKLRQFRENVAKVYREFGLGDGLIVGEIGGDELTLAVDMSPGTVFGGKEDMDDFLLALKQATNTRVVKTVVSQAEKHVADQASEQAEVEAHLEAIKRAERGAAIAKDVEEAARKLTRILQAQGKDAVYNKLDGLSSVFVVNEAEGRVEANFVVVEDKNGFRLASGANRHLDYTHVKNDLDTILGRSHTPQ